MKVLDSDHEKSIKTGHIWAYLGYDDNGNPAYASMGYTKNWEAKGPAEFLKEFNGTLQGDGYKGWKSISKKALAIFLHSLHRTPCFGGGLAGCSDETVAPKHHSACKTGVRLFCC